MLKATTLVHKGAIQIGIHAISSFARHFSKTHHLYIHIDPSVDENDQQLLLKAANGIAVKIVTPAERHLKLAPILSQYPKTNDLLKTGSYFTKLELVMYEEDGFFYFDSDIIWLRPVDNLQPNNAPNAFSTESWTWYPGIRNENRWLKLKVPRRVNTGFFYINELFPYQKMEQLLAQKMFDNKVRFAGDQELFAYLYDNMLYYHPEDLKRSRIGTVYNLKEDGCAALHFPGKMWMNHLEQIGKLIDDKVKPPVQVRYLPPKPLTGLEIKKMRLRIRAGQSKTLVGPLNLLRNMRRVLKQKRL